MAMDQQTALERQQALYREKNAHLWQYLEPVEPYEFYREIFPKGPFERKGHYEDAKGNAIALTVPKKQDSQENGVALEIDPHVHDVLGGVRATQRDGASRKCVQPRRVVQAMGGRESGRHGGRGAGLAVHLVKVEEAEPSAG